MIYVNEIIITLVHVNEYRFYAIVLKLNLSIIISLILADHPQTRDYFPK